MVKVDIGVSSKGNRKKRSGERLAARAPVAQVDIPIAV